MLASYSPSTLSLLVPVAVAAGLVFLIRRVAKDWHLPGPWPCRISHHYIAFFELLCCRPQMIAEWHRQYGPFVLIAPGQISISDVTAMRDLYSSSKRNEKSSYFDHFVYHNARSIFAEKPHTDHRGKRGLSSAFYQPTSIYRQDLQVPLRERALAVRSVILDKLSNQNIIDVFPLVNHYAWDNVTSLVFGPRHGSHTILGDEGVQDILSRLKNSELWNSLKYNLPFVHFLVEQSIALYTGSPKFLSGERDLDTWAMQRLDRALADPLTLSDRSVIQLFQSLRQEGRDLSDDYVACEVVDNLQAAQATITVALTYALYHISRNPEWQVKIQEELDALPKEQDGLPVWTELEKAPVLEACMRESYRLNPVSSGRAERVLASDGHYGKVHLPANYVASASTIAIQLDPKVFPEPLEFEPRRWLDASGDDLLKLERSYIPFGYGARLCLGKAFSVLETKTVLAAIFLHFNSQLDVPGRVMDQWGTQDALPKGLKCDIRFSRRTTA